MDFAMPYAGEAELLLGAMLSVAQADVKLEPRERSLLNFCRDLYGLDTPVEALAPVTPAELAARLGDDPEQRRRLVRQLIVMSMLDEEVHPRELEQVEAFAEALGVDEPTLRTLELLVEGKRRRMAADFMRRSFIAHHLADVRKEQGAAGVWRLGKSLLGLGDGATAARYRALGELPEGSLGRVYHDHLREQGYALPGERGGAPEALIFHDLGHVLIGLGTSPGEELRVAAFEAGYMGEDSFSVTVFAMLLFHMGQEMGTEAKPERGWFDVETWTESYALGQRLHMDLRHWDPAPHWAQPLEAVRRSLGL